MPDAAAEQTGRIESDRQPSRRQDPYAASVREELRRVYIQQGARVPVVALLAIGSIAWTFHTHVPRLLLAGWATLVAAFLLLRWGLCALFSRADVAPAELARRMRIIVVLRMAAGLSMGAAALLWFPTLPLWEKMIFMIACFGWYATTVVVSLASPASAFLFGASLMAPTAIAWSIQTDYQGFFAAMLTIALVFFIRQSTEEAHAAMRAAIRSRLREEDLARRLERHGTDLETAMRAKSQFLAAASHDLRQPVTSMNLLLSALAASRDEASLRSVAAKFEAPLRALEEILSSILEVSRLEAGTIEVTRRHCFTSEVIAPVIEEYRPRAAAKRLRLDALVPELPIHTDPEIVRRVLRNLLDNAIKFTDSGAVRIEAHRKGAALVLAVSDTGRGIAKAQHAQVFEDYYQGDNPQRDRRQGLGLGLAIVRRLVGLLGGEISLKSEPGRGTRFEVRLPGAIDSHRNESEVQRDTTPEPGMLRSSKVLVVEDDRLVIDALSTLFRTLKVEARFAIDADDALMETALGRFIPDVALVDYGLPGNLDGISLVRELRVRLPRCVFLLVTGDTRPEVIRRAAEAGVPTLHKPVTVERLNEKLKELGVAA